MIASRVFSVLDDNGDGMIQFPEFVMVCFSLFFLLFFFLSFFFLFSFFFLSFFFLFSFFLCFSFIF